MRPLSRGAVTMLHTHNMSNTHFTRNFFFSTFSTVSHRVLITPNGAEWKFNRAETDSVVYLMYF